VQLTGVSRGRPALTLPHVRYGLSMRWMAVFCTFRKPSMCRPMHRPFMRNELLDLATIVPATACHQRNYIETYSRSKQRLINELADGVNERHCCHDDVSLGCRPKFRVFTEKAYIDELNQKLITMQPCFLECLTIEEAFQQQNI
jgi:hypothetical protein